MKPNTVIMGFGTTGETRNDYFQGQFSCYYTDQLRIDFPQASNPYDFDENKPYELIKTMQDMIRLEKNLCVARNFHRLNPENKKYIDVWVVSWFKTPNNSVSDPGESFMMQLGTILTMTKDWKKFQLRMFVRIMDEETRDDIVKQLRHTLKTLRIPANVFTIMGADIHSIVQVSFGDEKVVKRKHVNCQSR